MPAKRGSTRTVTGADMAWVNVDRPPPDHVVGVPEGQDLPDNLKDGEIERLEALGVFDEHPRDIKARAMQSAIDRGQAGRVELPVRSAEELNALGGGSDGDEDDDVGEHLGATN